MQIITGGRSRQARELRKSSHAHISTKALSMRRFFCFIVLWVPFSVRRREQSADAILRSVSSTMALEEAVSLLLSCKSLEADEWKLSASVSLDTMSMA